MLDAKAKHLLCWLANIFVTLLIILQKNRKATMLQHCGIKNIL